MILTAATRSTVFMAALMLAIWGTPKLFGLPGPSIALSLFLLVSLLALCWFDFDRMILPNFLTYPLIVTGLVRAWFVEAPILDHILGSIIGYTIVVVINFVWRKRRGRDGMGLGDAKLFSACGAWFGALAIPMIFLIASGSALALIVVTGKLRADTADQPFAFGPFIVLAFWTMWVLPLNLA
ncbi:MAG: A24 family peptidase [Pseudomonadota bacterium]